jgi:MFS family permease
VDFVFGFLPITPSSMRNPMSTSRDTSGAIAANAHRLLWAGFMAILAAGVGFSIRAGILSQWAEKFGFTMTELGQITGGGLTGFGIIILLSSFLADSLGYGRLMSLAFLTHLVSAILTLAAGYAFASGGKDAAFQCLFWGMFLFAIGNGIAEAVVNPLVATLFPNNKTHYLNILHAGWPGGLIVGGLASYFMNPDGGKPVSWEVQISLFLVPVVLYGAMLLGQSFPKSEASQAGVSLGEMFTQVFAPLMLVLLLIHALVGYVELGTDSWITKITGAIMESKQKGLLLFVYTSALMFLLRFFAGPIVHRISPLGLLFVSALLGFVGLNMLGAATTVVACVIAATVYAIGKTFLWPTMLAVASEQFPKGGAITIGALGGIGMLSAGLLGGPGIGFKQDYNATVNLKEKGIEVYNRYKAPKENSFFGFRVTGLDGAKVGVLEDGGKELSRASELLKKEGRTDKNTDDLSAWWQEASKTAANDKTLVTDAGLYGGRQALKLTSLVPLTMAVLYLLLILYFRSRGGYKPKNLDGTGAAH